MSTETQKQISLTLNAVLKLIAAIGIAACTMIVNDMRSSVEKLSVDMSDVRERLARLEGRKYQTSETNERQ